MTKREVVKLALNQETPPYVPWSFSFTVEAKEKLIDHYGHDDIIDAVGSHILGLGSDIGFFTDMSNNCVRDVFGVVWDRSIDKDIGNVKGCVLPEATLSGCMEKIYLSNFKKDVWNRTGSRQICNDPFLRRCRRAL